MRQAPAGVSVAYSFFLAAWYPGRTRANRLSPASCPRRGAIIWLVLIGRHPIGTQREVRAQNELTVETTRLKAAVCLGDLIEGEPLGDPRSDGASCQEAEEPLQVLPEPIGTSRPHYVDRIETGALPGTQLQRYKRAIHINMVSIRRCACTPAE